MAVDEQTGLLYSTHPAKRIDLFVPRRDTGRSFTQTHRATGL